MSDTLVGDADGAQYPPVVTSEPQLSWRAIVTGCALGGALALANIYSGLKIGWSFNMSITAALLAFGLWSGLYALRATRRRFTLIENNLNQAGASAAASISSSGLVSAMPALTLLDGHRWNYWELALWLLCCSALGVFVAVLFRRRMLIVERLTFPAGVATAETLKEMYARGAEALARVKALVVAAAVAAGWKLAVAVGKIAALPFPGRMAIDGPGAAAAKVGSLTLGKLGFALDPSLIMVGAGAIMGLRVCAWMFAGAILAWLVIGGYVLDQGWVAIELVGRPLHFAMLGTTVIGSPETVIATLKGGSPDAWLLWPGVTLLVSASLASLVFALPQFVVAVGLGRVLPLWLRPARASGTVGAVAGDPHEMPTRWLVVGVVVVTALTLVCGHVFFGMHPLVGLAAVALTSVLAVVALRVAGETNVTPIGPMGKVTQLTFGAIDPGNVSTNLMAANITGGSASQAADMMFDLKSGLMLGASPRAQAVSQLFGVVVGAFVGAGVYLLLMDSIGGKLMTAEWAAPAVKQWKSVAELFRDGFDKMPRGALDAMVWAGVAGVAMTVLERAVPRRWKPWTPSASAIGIAFLISAATSFSFFLGGLAAWVVGRWAKAWYLRFGVVVASGLIAGESLTGMIHTIVSALG